MEGVFLSLTWGIGPTSEPITIVREGMIHLIRVNNFSIIIKWAPWLQIISHSYNNIYIYRYIHFISKPIKYFFSKKKGIKYLLITFGLSDNSISYNQYNLVSNPNSLHLTKNERFFLFSHIHSNRGARVKPNYLHYMMRQICYTRDLDDILR